MRKKKATLVDKAFKKLALAADDIARFAGGKPTRRAENEDYKRAYERIVLLHEALSKKVNEMVPIFNFSFRPANLNLR